MAPKLRNARIKWAAYYQIKLYELNQHYLRTGETHLFEQEWPQIQRAQNWCASQIDEDKAARILCSKFAGVGGNLLELRIPRLMQIIWMEAGLEAARKAKIKLEEAAYLNHLGYVHWSNGNPARAIEYCEKALVISREIKSLALESAALSHLAMFYIEQNESRKAIEAAETAIKLSSGPSNPRTKATILNILGTAYKNLTHYQDAMEYYRKALEIAREKNDLQLQSIILSNQSNTLLKLSEPDEARVCAEQALRIAREIGDIRGEGLALTRLAEIISHSKDPHADSLAVFETALTAYRKSGDRLQERKILTIFIDIYQQHIANETSTASPQNLCHLLNKLAGLHRDLGDFSEAIKAYQQMIAVAREMKSIYNEFVAVVNLAQCNIFLKEYEPAIHYHRQALAHINKLESNPSELDITQIKCDLLLGLGQAYRHTDKVDDAQVCYEKALKLAIQANNYHSKAKCYGNLGLLYADDGKPEEALHNLHKSLKILDDLKDYAGMAACIFNIGYVHSTRKEFQTALAYARKALKIYEQINDPNTAEVRRQMDNWLRNIS